MKDTYTVKQAMDRLGIKGIKTFLRLEQMYPHEFIVVKQTKGLDGRHAVQTHYDKAAIDKFAQMREHLKQVNP